MLNVWKIQGTYKGETETIDTFDGSEREAREMAWEYGIAFGPAWHIEVVADQVDPLDY